MLRAPCLLLLLLAAGCCQAVDFYFRNNLPYTVWIGCLGNAGKAPLNGGGWEMPAYSSVTVSAPNDWAGRFWARTGCGFDGAGNGHCVTGDCGNRLACNGAGGAPPVTLAEITLAGWGGLDYYDISNVDGFNVPMKIQPRDRTGQDYDCTAASCPTNINDRCPDELKQWDNGQVVACKSACLAFNTDQYCCRGDFGTPDRCQSSDWPVNYPAIFKEACPLAYSYAYDDQKSTFTCSNTNYDVVVG